MTVPDGLSVADVQLIEELGPPHSAVFWKAVQLAAAERVQHEFQRGWDEAIRHVQDQLADTIQKSTSR